MGCGQRPEDGSHLHQRRFVASSYPKGLELVTHSHRAAELRFGVCVARRPLSTARGKPQYEKLCLEEWKLDVPTISEVYRASPYSTVVYFNGLGRPFWVGGLDNERHWLNRVWTVQEATDVKNLIIGGKTPESIDQNSDSFILDNFHDRVGMVCEVVPRIFQSDAENITQKVVKIMRTRFGVVEYDKIVGISLLLPLRRIPIYNEKLPVEDA